MSCQNCFRCLNREELERRFENSMNISLYNKIKFGCNCYMCNDKTSASCVEIILFYREGQWTPNLIEEEIKEIKKQIKKDNHRLFLRYLLCTFRFNELYKTVIEKRFAPGGKGYLEAKQNFEMLKL